MIKKIIFYKIIFVASSIPIFNVGTVTTLEAALEFQESSAAYDDYEDIAKEMSEYLNIGMIRMGSGDSLEKLHILFSVNHPFPEAGLIHAEFRILLDTDNNLETGKTWEGIQGINAEICILVKGDQSQGPLNVEGWVITNLLGQKVLEPPPQFSHLMWVACGISESVEGVAGENFDLDVPRDWLSLKGPQIPVTLISEDSGKTVDKVSFVFQHKANAVLTSAMDESLQFVNFNAEKLTPNRNFRITIGDEFIVEDVALEDKTDKDGAFQGRFRLPVLNGGRYYVVVQDDSGVFAFNVIKVPTKEERISRQSDAPPTVKISVSPLVVKRGEEVNISLSAMDDRGLDMIWWWGENTGDHELDKAHTYACKGRECYYTWKVSTDVTGEMVLCANAMDTADPIPGEAHQASEGEGIPCIHLKVVDYP